MRSPSLVAWVAHFLCCDRCGAKKVLELYSDLHDPLGNALRKPRPRAELCAKGVALLDAWLDEPDKPRRIA